MAKVYKVGTARFQSKAIAERVTLNKIAFAATVNRENQTQDEKAEAFRAFFNIKSR